LGQRAFERASANNIPWYAQPSWVILVLEDDMSPTAFVVRCAELNRDLEAARRAGDLVRMRSILAEKTSLLRAMDGQPE
jgi:hypothetical protein